MEKGFYFEKLEIYKRSLKLAIEICKIAANLPIKFSRIRDQLIGAAISVPLNIAEGAGRNSNKEKRNFCRMARSSLFECIPLLEICNELKLMSEQNFEKFNDEILELSKMLTKFIQSL
jgi:four helix bundle protein